MALALVVGCTNQDATGQRCGGYVYPPSPRCPAGFECVSSLDGGASLPDMGGVCRKANSGSGGAAERGD
jgi:hypothetical protein